MRNRQAWIGIGLFALLLIAGLIYVKWFPYYHKAFLAAAKHSIGPSIITGTGAAAPAPSWNAALDYAWVYGKAIWQAMVLGLLLGAGVQTLIPTHWIAKTLGGSRLGVAAGGLLGMPTMMCTCCAAPVVVGLRRSEASVGASVAFWLSNTLLNPATMIFMTFVLGWKWALLRLVAGGLMTFGLAGLVQRMMGPLEEEKAQEALEELVEPPAAGPMLVRWLKNFATMFIALLPEYLLLVLLLGAARAWLFPTVPTDVGNHPLWVAGMAFAGTLFVIPTAGEIPIIQSLRALGLGAGPAAALLVTLPAISLPSLLMVSRVFKPRVLLFLTLGVILSGILTGLVAMALQL